MSTSNMSTKLLYFHNIDQDSIVDILSCLLRTPTYASDLEDLPSQTSQSDYFQREPIEQDRRRIYTCDARRSSWS